MSSGNAKLAAGLLLGAGLGLMLGYLLATPQDVAGLRGGLVGESGATGSDPEALAAAKAESERLAAEVAELKARLAPAGDAPTGMENPSARLPLKPATEGMSGEPQVDWDAEKKQAAASKARSEWKGKGGTGKGASSDPPDGMTHEEWDDAVRVIVDGHNWRESLSALQRLGDAKSSGRPMEPADLQAWESMQAAWGALEALGVGRGDPRVLRGTVPGRINALGANLNDSQAAQLGQTVEEIATRDAARPEPTAPVRFATETAHQLRNVIALEAQMGTLLNAEQLQAYLAEVGDDPFASGWQTKPWQQRLAGTTEAIASLALGHWSNSYGVTEAAHRAVLAREAASFAAAATEVPGPVAGLDTAGRRRAVLEQAARVAELQGAAEHRFLTAGLGLQADALAAALQRHAPVFVITGD